MKIKSLCMIVLMLVGLLAVSGIASAAVTINNVKVNGDAFDDGAINILDVEKNDELEIKVTATPDQDYQDVQISAYIRGNERDLVEDITETFNMKENVSYVKRLKLSLPQRMSQKTYTLIVRVEDNSGEIQSELRYSLEIDTARHAIQIRDVILSPENYIKAGRVLIATARIKNRGESKEEDLKVKVSMPELGISASDYIDELDHEGGTDDSITSEELPLRIPDCAEPGEYTVRVCVDYDDGDEEECETTSIDIVEGDFCPAIASPIDETTSKTIVTIGPESQDLTAGQSSAYSVTLTNQGIESKSYTIEADAAWATVTITPTNVVVVGAGESKTVFVNVEAGASEAVGEKMFSVSIKSGDKVLKQVPLKANVKQNTGGLGSIKRVLEIGLVVLVVLLVVVGLIIGFNKLKGSDEEEKEEQTYY